MVVLFVFFFFQAEDGIRDLTVTGVQTCALPISGVSAGAAAVAGRSGFLAATGAAGRGSGGPLRRVSRTTLPASEAARAMDSRSEERRVGKECRRRWSPQH